MIRAAILDGTLPPGSRIRQEALAAQLGVSRAPVREALIVLKREGLVQMKRWQGAVVAILDTQFIANVYELRGAVDAHVAATLASREDWDADTFRRIIADGQAAVDKRELPDLITHDLRFHMSLYRATGNPVLVEVMEAQWTHLRRAMVATLTTRGYPQRAWDEHAGIVEAIAERDVDRARTLALAHTIKAKEILVASLDALKKTAPVENGDDGVPPSEYPDAAM